jgi:putative ABC transport system permease protein
MDTVFNASPASLAGPLVIALVILLLPLVWRAFRSPHLARIGVRNVVRQRIRTLLILFGLMLATTFVSAALTIDDTLVLAVKNVAVFDAGRVDEEVRGGSGSLGLYPDSTGATLLAGLANQPHVAGIAPALTLDDVLIVDDTSRQVRGRALAIALSPESSGPLAQLQHMDGSAAPPISALGPADVYLNRSAGALLGAQPGDTLDLYSESWAGQRFTFTVRAIVSGGPFGAQPAVMPSLDALQVLAGAPHGINRVYVANAGDGVSGVVYSDEITQTIRKLAPGYSVNDVKQADVAVALQAQDIFGRILTLYTLFAFSIGLLLVFLIFSLLAAERRTELGMVRAVGMHRADVVWMLLFEGTTYDVFAAIPGVLAGLGLGVLIIAVVSPAIASLGFPLRADLEPRSMAVAFCLGLLFTLATILLAVWTVSRVTVAAALRGLPEPPAAGPSTFELLGNAVRALPFLLRAPQWTASAWGRFTWALTARGPVPLVLGVLLLRWALGEQSALAFSIGLSLTLTGGVLLAQSSVIGLIAAILRLAHSMDAYWLITRVTLVSERLSAVLIGGGLVLYWSLPFDTLQQLGLPHFSGGIDVFFAAGVMMVFGAVLALTPNLDLLLVPVKWIVARVGRARHVTYIAFIYPAMQRFRTGVSLSLFSLVCFTMVVMACIASSTTQRYGDVAAQTGGYDIIGQPLFSPVGGVSDVMSALSRQSPSAAAQVTAISGATPIPLGVLQTTTDDARWTVYPGSELQGSFLQGSGLPLVARAAGFASDADVWQAVRNNPGDVVIDTAALDAQSAAALGIKRPPPAGLEQFAAPPLAADLLGIPDLRALLARSVTQSTAHGLPDDVARVFDDPTVLRDNTPQLQHVVLGPGVIAPTSLWVADLRGGDVTQLTVVGITDNAQAQSYGLLGSPQTFDSIERGLAPFGNQYYFFKLAPGADAHAVSRAIGSALAGYGFETTVIADVLLDTNGPRVFASKVLVGLVALTLLVGMAALSVTGMRAVVERRQQIGMLRALGFRRFHVRLLFALESLIVAATGTALGLGLGLILCRNVFAVDFFETIRSGINLVVPWGELALICALAFTVALAASLVPAWQASQIMPADALRYE